MFAFFICILTDGDFKNVILTPSGNRPSQTPLLEFVFVRLRRDSVAKQTHLQTSELVVCKAAIAVGNAPSESSRDFSRGRIHCKASVIAYVMNNETILCARQDIFDGMLGSKETDAENCSCVSVSDKEFARLHSKFGLKKEDVLEAIKAYAQELGLEYGPVNYFMMCDPKYANDLGEVVQ